MNTAVARPAPPVFMDSSFRWNDGPGSGKGHCLHTSLPHSAALAMAARLAFMVKRSYIAQVSSFSFRISTSQRTSP